MQLPVKHVLFIVGLNLLANSLSAQVPVSGTVYDETKRNPVENVIVQSTSGAISRTDSLGSYKINVTEKDSLTFIYQEKPTQKFSVKEIADPSHFDISLRISVPGKYSTLKEVIVFTRSYKQDSMENRQAYADVYNYQKPGIRTSINPNGAVGADLDEIINMFRFRRNKNLKAFQARLEQQEQDKYVEYRFNKNFVGRITHLKGENLDSFLVKYRPTYEFTSMSDEVTFNRYVLNASYRFKLELLQNEKQKKSILPEN